MVTVTLSEIVTWSETSTGSGLVAVDLRDAFGRLTGGFCWADFRFVAGFAALDALGLERADPFLALPAREDAPPLFP